MYQTFMTVVRTFFGSGLYLAALKIAVPTVVLALLAWSSPAFRAFCRSWRERGGWRAISVAIPTAVVKLFIVLVLARLIMVAMVYQAQMFEFKHGNITEANRSAVLMKWGYPHQQKEIEVSFTRKRTWVTRQLLIPGDEKRRDTVTRDSFWKDENVPVQAIDGVLPKVISVREEQKDVAVVQKALDQADVQVVLTADERKLGGANYAGYRDAWRLQFTVVNRCDKPVTAHVHFPLPAKTGNYKDVELLVDGESVADRASTSEQGIRWTMDMEPGQKSVVLISYEGRGLDYLRYIPRRMTQTGHYLVTATVNNIKPKEMDWCIGSMPPDQDLDRITGMPYKLTWTLDNALTSYDVGIKLPEAKQPSYHVARLLNQAPVGLIMLLVMLVVPRIIIGRPLSLMVVALTSAAYYLLYTFMGRLADVIPYFWLSFLISFAVLSALVAFLRLKDKSSPVVSWQDTVAFVALAVVYPLAVIDADRTALWMQVFYVAILVYACVLVVRFRVVPAVEAHRKRRTPTDGSND